MTDKIIEYLEKLKIRTKLQIFLIIPAIALSFFVVTTTSLKWEQFQEAKKSSSFIHFFSGISDLLYELQKERGITTGYMVSHTNNKHAELLAQRKLTDDKLLVFMDEMKDQSNLNPSKRFLRLRGKLEALSTVRAAIDSPANKKNFFANYSELNVQVLNSIRIMDKLINSTSSALESRQTELYITLLWLTERAGQERAMFFKAIKSGVLSEEESWVIRSFYFKQLDLLEKYAAIASEKQLDEIQTKRKNTIWFDVNSLREKIFNRIIQAELLDRLSRLLNSVRVINSSGSFLYKSVRVVNRPVSDVGQEKEKYLGRVNQMYANAWKIIEQYRGLGEMSAIDTFHLNNIETTFKQNRSFFHAAILKKSLAESKELNKVDNKPAFKSIAILRQAFSLLNAEESWDITTKRINVIRGISNRIRQQMTERAMNINQKIIRALILYFLITLVALLAITYLGYLLMRRLVGEISTISTTMRHMQTSANHDKLLRVSGNDEISDMARSFNELILERNSTNLEVNKLSRAVESSPSQVVITDLDGVIEYVNQKFVDVTGYDKEEVIGQKITLLKSGNTPGAIYAQMWKTITSGKDWSGEIQNQYKNGVNYWARISISSVENAIDNITHYVSFQEDITQEYQLSKQLNYQASHDSLTGLINRREFETYIERLLVSNQNESTQHAICFMDLDQFKIVNDTCGHAAGDELLRQISTLIKQNVRVHDSLARIGGDEFSILMEHCSLENAERVMASMLKAVKEYQFYWEGSYFKVGMSIGVVAINESMDNLTELFKEVDAACYMAKESGGNRIHIYSPHNEEIAMHMGEMQWVAHIQRALEEDSFCLYAQAIEPMNGNTSSHYELLIRMLDENGMIIPPGTFLRAAERYKLITQIDQWVVENALSLLKGHPAFLKKIQFISINLSGPSLADDSFLQFVTNLIKHSNIDGTKICFEITETAAISNLFRAKKFISVLREFGCRFALDDFGSGLSSFGYLKNLSIDYLKIDGMFVKGIVDEPIDRAMVKSINEIGQVMGMKTIAEFVENDAIRDMLKELGVNYAQGYGVAKPMPFDELLKQTDRINSSGLTDKTMSLSVEKIHRNSFEQPEASP
jgi:diguanylate cyclase (GGDEF)-like protein/PAS domain S-box-containing protein